jgi:hypothetical protein
LKPKDADMTNCVALLPYIEKGKKFHQERSILYQTPKRAKEHHQQSSPVYHTVTHRTQRRRFSHNESVKAGKNTDNSLLHFSVDDSLGLEITGNYYIFLSHLCIMEGYCSSANISVMVLAIAIPNALSLRSP